MQLKGKQRNVSETKMSQFLMMTNSLPDHYKNDVGAFVEPRISHKKRLIDFMYFLSFDQCCRHTQIENVRSNLDAVLGSME